MHNKQLSKCFNFAFNFLSSPKLVSTSRQLHNHRICLSSCWQSKMTHRRCYSLINSNSEKLKLLDNFDNLLFDCDGVVYMGNNPIDGAIAAIEKLTNLGKNIYYITNNSSRSRRDLADKFAKLGFPSDDLKIVTAASSAAFHCKRLLAGAETEKKKVFFIGVDCLREELQQLGLETIGASDLTLPKHWSDWLDFRTDPKVGAVVVGADWDFNYSKATAAASHLIADDVILIGTDRDNYFPTPNPHVRQVGTGSIVKMVETGSGREAFYAGKPDLAMWEHIKEEYHEQLDLTRTLMVGDTLYSDIQFGNSLGMSTLLVETGNHKLQNVENLSHSIQIPTFIAKSLKDAILIQ